MSAEYQRTLDVVFVSGVITVSNSDLLDFETSRRRRLIVIATTTHNNAYDYATVWVNVADVNDHVPQFYQERYQSSVYENYGPHTFVLQVCSSSTTVLPGEIPVVCLRELRTSHLCTAGM